MKVYCKRNQFLDDKIKWEKGSWYEFEKPHGYESNYIFGYIEVKDNYEISKSSISKSDFNKYFYTQKEFRDIRIQEILK